MVRQSLPTERESITHHFVVDGHDGYITASHYPDGRTAEVFVTISKEGMAERALLNSLATITSIALQGGITLEDITQKMENISFEPSGMTRNKDIPHCRSIVDYVFRWLMLKEVECKNGDR